MNGCTPLFPAAIRSAAKLVARAASPGAGLTFLRLARGAALISSVDRSFLEAFGVPLISLSDPEPEGPSRSATGEQVSASPALARLLSQPARVAPRTPPGALPEPDEVSALWIRMIAATAQAGGGCHFALRQRSDAPTEASGDFAGLLSQAAGLPTRIVDPDAHVPLLTHVLREEIHAGAAAPIVVFLAGRLVREDAASEADYDDVDGFLTGNAAAVDPGTAAAALHLGGLRCTYVWQMPPSCEPPPSWRHMLSAWVGPLSYDLAWARRTVAEAAPELSERAVDAALARVDHPREASASVRFATIVARSAAGVGVDEALDLAGRSFAHHAGGARPRPRAQAWDRRLFVSDHEGDLDTLENAPRLVRDGCRILLVGPPGGGKSAWAMEFARKAGRPVETLEGARFLAHRLGSLERNLARLVQTAVRAGALVWADEIDSLCGVRTGEGGGNAVLVRTLTNEVIRLLDATAGEIALVAAANDAEAIDPGVRRRFDVVVNVAADLPKEREAVAWEAILGMRMPTGFAPLGASCVADYALAASRLKMVGRRDPSLAADLIRRARDARLGRSAPRPYGFFGGE